MVVVTGRGRFALEVTLASVSSVMVINVVSWMPCVNVIGTAESSFSCGEVVITNVC